MTKSARAPKAHRSLVIGAWSLVIPFLTGCFGPDPAKIAAENDRLRRENLELTRRVEKLEKDAQLRTAQIDTLQQRLETKSNVQGVAPGDVPTAVKLELGRFSAAYDTDGDGVFDTLRVYVTTLDQRGRFVPVVGKALLQAVAVREGAAPVTLVDQPFAPPAFEAAYRSGVTGTHYTLEAKLPSPLPQGVNEATAKVTVTDAATGVVLTVEKPFALNAKHTRSVAAPD